MSLIDTARGATTKYWGHFGVQVDDTEVQTVLDRIDNAVEPAGLALWMETAASPVMADGIVEHFATDGGGGLAGGWAPLQESTIRIKAELGVADPMGINTRTDEMLTAMVTDHRVSVDVIGAEMEIPGDLDRDLREKLSTAAFGKTQTDADMMPGAYTPPRPVAVVTSLEAAMLMISLEQFIMRSAAGGAAIGAVAR
jgi:hypothetical protein